MAIRSFLDLNVYQRSYQAALTVNREVVPKLPDTEKYDLKDQLRRASKAVPALIAEGYARKHHKKDWQKYIDDDIGEANEMIVHLSLTRDLYTNYVNPKICEQLIEEYDIIGKQLFRLGKSWNSDAPTSHPHDPTHLSHPILFAIPPSLALKLPGNKAGESVNIPEGFTLPITLDRLFQTGLQLMFIAAVVLSLFFILWSGIQWITSGGDKQALEKARARLTYAIVGLIIVFLAFFIVNLIGGFFGINLIGPTPSGGGGEE